MSGGDEDQDKTFEPTPQKLEKARKKGEFPRSADLHTAAGYLGFTISLFAFGGESIKGLGTALMVLLDQSDALSATLISTDPRSVMGGFLSKAATSVAPVFVIPALGVMASILAQRAFVVAPSKLQPKLSRINPIANAKNKFGRAGLFEFSKSFVKLVIFGGVLTVFLSYRMPEMMAAVTGDPRLAMSLLAELILAFLTIIFIVSALIGGLDAVFQHQEHLRKNRMSRKEIQDETKDAEGDPHLKNERRQRAQAIALTQMMTDVPDADVIIVNPTHYAVALKWARTPGSAPICVAKGVDEIAMRIREIATDNAVPIHSDPPTARALHAAVEIGEEIAQEHYFAVAAAIRFAQDMRVRAKKAYP